MSEESRRERRRIEDIKARLASLRARLEARRLERNTLYGLAIQTSELPTQSPVQRLDRSLRTYRERTRLR